MQIKSIALSNLSSFIDFQTEGDFQKNNLIFGTNGAGKSTLVALLRLDAYQRFRTPERERELAQFLKVRRSKEAINDDILFQLNFASKEYSLSYNANHDNLSVRKDCYWTPIKVFNDEYSILTIGDKVQLDKQSAGITIGAPNRAFESARKRLENLKNEQRQKFEQAESIVEGKIQLFRDRTRSTASISEDLSLETLLSKTCNYDSDKEAMEQRGALGFARPEDPISLFDLNQLNLDFESKYLDEICRISFTPPQIANDIRSLLLSFTEFYKKGIEIYTLENRDVCPFCLRDWPSAAGSIEAYQSFVKSTFNESREKVKKYRNQVAELKNKVKAAASNVARFKTSVKSLAEKYNVDFQDWIDIKLDEEAYQDALDKIDRKHEDMSINFSVEKKLKNLVDLHVSQLRKNNKILKEINNEIRNLRTRRTQLNQRIRYHFAHELWHGGGKIRLELAKIDELITSTTDEIERLQDEAPDQDVVQEVFNSLVKFAGVGEYELDNERRLILKINGSGNFDISTEGQRVSSAQRKLLSLCYFFAEAVAEAESPQDLRHVVLVFDDPVDSADYIYFHSIAVMIERADYIISKILKQDIKFSQTFVYTHNALLFDRLNASKWRHVAKSMKKENNQTIVGPAERSANNYNEYINAICRYYKNPNQNKNQMIFIGNILRRVLEIIASFNSLGSNDYRDILDGHGKPRLAILVNHLSHESFTKCLNPLSCAEELQNACRELFEVIREIHPEQFKTIIDRHEISLNDQLASATTT